MPECSIEHRTAVTDLKGPTRSSESMPRKRGDRLLESCDYTLGLVAISTVTGWPILPVVNIVHRHWNGYNMVFG